MKITSYSVQVMRMLFVALAALLIVFFGSLTFANDHHVRGMLEDMVEHIGAPGSNK